MSSFGWKATLAGAVIVAVIGLDRGLAQSNVLVTGN